MSRRSGSEAHYRDAFTRLKEGRPVILAFGAHVSQNNVALEAGKHPSALRKERFPNLIADIQEYCGKVSTKGEDANASAKPGQIAKLKETIELLKKKQELEASRVLSLLIEATHLKKLLAAKSEPQEES